MMPAQPETHHIFENRYYHQKKVSIATHLELLVGVPIVHLLRFLIPLTVHNTTTVSDLSRVEKPGGRLLLTEPLALAKLVA